MIPLGSWQSAVYSRQTSFYIRYLLLVIPYSFGAGKRRLCLRGGWIGNERGLKLEVSRSCNLAVLKLVGGGEFLEVRWGWDYGWIDVRATHRQDDSQKAVPLFDSLS